MLLNFKKNTKIFGKEKEHEIKYWYIKNENFLCLFIVSIFFAAISFRKRSQPLIWRQWRANPLDISEYTKQYISGADSSVFSQNTSGLPRAVYHSISLAYQWNSRKPQNIWAVHTNLGLVIGRNRLLYKQTLKSSSIWSRHYSIYGFGRNLVVSR